LSTTLSGSTPRCSTTIFLTRSPISLIFNLVLVPMDPTPRRFKYATSYRGR